jgi:hypothetical protein
LMNCTAPRAQKRTPATLNVFPAAEDYDSG